MTSSCRQRRSLSLFVLDMILCCLLIHTYTVDTQLRLMMMMMQRQLWCWVVSQSPELKQFCQMFSLNIREVTKQNLTNESRHKAHREAAD